MQVQDTTTAVRSGYTMLLAVVVADDCPPDELADSLRRSLSDQELTLTHYGALAGVDLPGGDTTVDLVPAA